MIMLIGSLCAATAVAANSAHIQPPSDYANSGTITYCSDFTNPPREFYNQGKPAGADVDLAAAMAERLGLSVDWLQVEFSGLIPSLQAGQCDMIVGELFIKPQRQEVIDLLPFSVSAEQIVVRQGNAAGIQGKDDLVGLKVAVPNGTTFLQIMQAENKKRKESGKPQIDLLVVPTTRKMFHLVMIGMADAAGSTTTSSAYYMRKADGKLVTAGEPFHKILDGFGFRKDDDALREAMGQALEQLIQDGEYEAIFSKYSMQASMMER